MMIDEVGMKRMGKRLDELDIIMDEHFRSGKHIPDEIRKEYREVADKYNEMVYILKEEAAERFMKAIQDEKLPDIFPELPE